MTRKVSLALILASLTAAFTGGAWQRTQDNSTDLPYVQIGSETYSLEIAHTPEARARGLGGRDGLCSECGMLFLFERTEPQGFWMKGMRFPLDIVWLQDDLIVHVERNISPESQAVFRPETPANRVLEFNAGAMDGVNVGDRAVFSL